MAVQAKNFNLKFQTLARYVKKQKEAGDTPARFTPNYSCRRIFIDEQENNCGHPPLYVKFFWVEQFMFTE